MANFPLEAVDLRWSNGGDLVIGHDGDLADTSVSRYGSFIQEILTRVRSSLYDWATQPSIGAGLDEIVGEPNVKDTAETGKAKIIAALTRDGFCPKTLLDVKYAPVSKQHLMYRLRVAPPGLGLNDQITLTFLFNIRDYEVNIL